jgi:hypothetical protein
MGELADEAQPKTGTSGRGGVAEPDAGISDDDQQDPPVDSSDQAKHAHPTGICVAHDVVACLGCRQRNVGHKL